MLKVAPRDVGRAVSPPRAEAVGDRREERQGEREAREDDAEFAENRGPRGEHERARWMREGRSNVNASAPTRPQGSHRPATGSPAHLPSAWPKYRRARTDTSEAPSVPRLVPGDAQLRRRLE